MASVFVTRRLPDEALDLLRKECRMEMNPHDRVLTGEEITKGVKDRDALLCLLTDTIDAGIIERAGDNLKIIANYAVGYNNIDVAAASRRRIMVTNTPGVLTETTADLAWSLLMAAGRRIAEGDRYVRKGKFVGWAPMLLLGGDIFGKTLGIIGLGRIGQAVAMRARGFGMRVIYTDAGRMPDGVEKELGAKFVTLQELLRESDFVSIHVPLLPETKHLIGEKELRMMRRTAYLVNTSRGPVIDEKALVKALEEGLIAGAGLDVYEDEPRLAPGLAKLENVVMLPHLGSASLETRTKMAVMAVQNILACFRHERPPNIVNPEVLKG